MEAQAFSPVQQTVGRNAVEDELALAGLVTKIKLSGGSTSLARTVMYFCWVEAEFVLDPLRAWRDLFFRPKFRRRATIGGGALSAFSSPLFQTSGSVGVH